MGTRPRRQLHRESTDPAGRAGDEHSSADHRAERAQRLQRGHAGHRECRRRSEVNRIRKHRKVFGRHGPSLCPSTRSVKAHNPAADRWT